ncbi:MAG: hypothetical protein AAFV29_19825, partial [Myxococcota bacterium]
MDRSTVRLSCALGISLAVERDMSGTTLRRFDAPPKLHSGPLPGQSGPQKAGTKKTKADSTKPSDSNPELPPAEDNGASTLFKTLAANGFSGAVEGLETSTAADHPYTLPHAPN